MLPLLLLPQTLEMGSCLTISLRLISTAVIIDKIISLWGYVTILLVTVCSFLLRVGLILIITLILIYSIIVNMTGVVDWGIYLLVHAFVAIIIEIIFGKTTVSTIGSPMMALIIHIVVLELRVIRCMIIEKLWLFVAMGVRLEMIVL